MQPRLGRLEKILGDPLFDILWEYEYGLSRLDVRLRGRIAAGEFRRIIFSMIMKLNCPLTVIR
jgi:hypothetical protein